MSVPERRRNSEPARDTEPSVSSEELYGELWAEDLSALDVELGQSLSPRATTMLYDEFARLGVGPDHLVLDAGARDAVHAIELVRRLHCRAVAVDPVSLHVDRARERVAAAGLEDRIDVVQGGLESLPLGDASIDFVWCRDVLNHVRLAPSLRELVRVLRPGGSILVYQTFAEVACEPEEARRLFEATATVAENMSARFFEATAREAGFEVVSVERLQGEWRERMIEDGTLGRRGRPPRAVTPAPPGTRSGRASRPARESKRCAPACSGGSTSCSGRPARRSTSSGARLDVVPTPRDILGYMRTVSRGSPVDRRWSIPGMVVSQLRHGRGNAAQDSPLTLQDVVGSEEYRNLMTAKVAVGDVAPEFELARLDGAGSVRLRSLVAEQPVALVFGSYT